MSLIPYKHACLFLLMALAAGSSAADSLKPFKDLPAVRHGAGDILERISGFENYSYHEGFENAFPEVKLWATNGGEPSII